MSAEIVLPPRQQTVRVEFDPIRPSLTVSPTSFDVQPGDVVIWQFFGLTRQWYPWIRFLTDSLGGAGTGPLGNLSQSSAAVWGTVQESAATPGTVTTWSYRASARVLEGLDDDLYSAAVSSAAVQLDVRSPDARKIEADVETISVDVALKDGRLYVPADRRTIELYGGQSIQWNFPPDLFGEQDVHPILPRVQFLRFDGKEQSAPLSPIDLHLGPFTTMTFGRSTVTATGYAQNPTGYYNYRLLVIRESEGEIVWASSPDPVVDDRGEPPPKGS